MKYALAIAVCGGICLLYAAIGAAAFGWERGGGILPLMLLFFVVGAVWKGMTGAKRTDAESKVAKAEQPKPPPFAGFQNIPESQKPKDSPKKLLTDGE